MVYDHIKQLKRQSKPRKFPHRTWNYTTVNGHQFRSRVNQYGIKEEEALMYYDENDRSKKAWVLLENYWLHFRDLEEKK